MRVIMVMFDTLTRKYLPNYGNDWVIAPNFKRLENHCCTFDQCYGGSMPCMPARRELHTGKYNFLHRSWGPLEPFDYSVFETLKSNHIYAHLCTDHSHYFEDGGATYHGRYSTWEGFRGQESDRWQPQGNGKEITNCSHFNKKGESTIQHDANMLKQPCEEMMSSPLTFQAGLDFLGNHYNQDQWFLQIESFDPHEPFEVPQKYRDLYDIKGDPWFNWPAYQPIDEALNQDELSIVRKEYAALISMCDAYLGKVLDFMDEHEMWKDTMLIVNTDHGFLLGEHNFLGKNFPPMYQEVIHTPLFIHAPGYPENVRREALVQSLDLVPTLLEAFQLEVPDEMDGKSLFAVMKDDQPIRDVALFGMHGAHVNITDGEYVFMKANVNDDNQPYVECTLMPTKMRGFFSKEELKAATFFEGDRFSNQVPYLKIPCKTYFNSKRFGDLLFDVKNDPFETSSIKNTVLVEKFTKLMYKEMERLHAPEEEFIRLGFER